MNQKRIDELIPVALRLLENPLDNFKQMMVDKNKIKSSYASAIDAFGPSVIQAGLVKTLAFYMKESEGTNRRAILELIKEVMKKNYPAITNYCDKNLLEIYIEETKNKSTMVQLQFRDKVLEAVTACKLAKLCFEKVDTESKEE
jgi:CRISPR/Cas system CMR-associated protein Cmr5 small subunit